jgi:hypothetical protein
MFREALGVAPDTADASGVVDRWPALDAQFAVRRGERR